MWDTDNRDWTGNRWTPFEDTITVLGVNLTGWDHVMTIRDSRTVGAVVRATLATVATDAQGIRLMSAMPATLADVAAWAAQGVKIIAGEFISVLRVRIDEAVMEAIDAAEDQGNAGADAVVEYDIHSTPAGGTKFVSYSGKFIVKQGATQA